MQKKVLCLLLIFLSTISIINFVNAKAEDSSFLTSIDLSTTTLRPGESNSIYLQINQATNLAGLSFEIYYDSSFFDFYNYYNYSVLSGSNISVNLDQDGVIKVSIISLEGITYSGNMMYFNFTSTSQTPIDSYLLDLAVLEVYDTNLTSLNVKSNDGKINVIESIQTIENVYFYDQISRQNLKIGDTFDYSFYSYNSKGLAAADFEIYYDKSILKVNQVKAAEQLSNNNDVIYSINSDTAGFIDISYASLSGMNYQNLFYITFEVIADINVTTQVQMIPKDLYDVDLNSLLGQEVSEQLNIEKTIVTPDYPNMYLKEVSPIETDVFDLEVIIDANSSLGAGDFTIHFDQLKLEVISVDVGDLVTTHHGYIVYDSDYTDGTITFSYINENGLSVAEVLLNITFRSVATTENASTEISISGSGLVDSMFEPIYLDFITYQTTLNDYKTVRFIDYNETILEEQSIPQSQTPVEPDVNQREGTSFSHWENVLLTNDLEIYQAVYDLNDDFIKLADETLTFDGNNHSLKINQTIDGLDITYKNNQHMNAGIHSVEADLYLDGIYQQTIEGTLTIEKAPITIDAKDFVLDISYNALTITHKDYSTDIRYSTDGTTYESGYQISNLEENTNYTLSIYVNETTNYEKSNVVTVDFKTMLSITSFMNVANSIVIDLTAYDDIVQLMEDKANLSTTDQVTATSKISTLINQYNTYVETINLEYETIYQHISNKIIALQSLSFIGVVLIFFRRRDIK